MTSERRYEQALAGRLADLAGSSRPDYVDEVLEITAHSIRRPAWMFPGRWSPVRLPSLAPAIRAIPVGSLLIVTLLILAIIAAIIYVGSSHRTPSPFGLASNGRIAYDRNGDIYGVDPATGDQVAIVTGSENDGFPLFSRQGDRIVFFRAIGDARLLFVADASGTGQIQIGGPYDGLDSVTWSPDGALIAVGYGLPAAPVIDLVRTDGTGSLRLDIGLGIEQPEWRPPDGRQLLVRARTPVGGDLYVVDRDGMDPHRLAIDSERVINDDSDVHHGSWSPDGTRIAYNAVVLSLTTGRHVQRIIVLEMSPAGTVVSKERLEFDPQDGDEGWPVWSPTGSRFVFMLSVANSSVYRVAVGPGDGSGRATIIGPPTTTHRSMERGWSPDERFVLARYWEEHEAWLLDPAGGAGHQVDYWASSVDAPTWQRTVD